MFRPTQFGKYYLTERIAVGGMAELFKAKLFGVSGFEKPMVVKQILPKYSRNSEFIKMFVDEAKIAVTLTHGNIVPVYELGRIDSIYFIAMEYIHGKDLADILEMARSKSKPVSLEHALYITIELCKGLDYAHRRTDPDGSPLRVVHRDVSPPNVLVSFDGEVKITDFGIAKATVKLGSTDAGVVKGTFGYMSPEQVRGLPVNHKTDIFSAGILLHEMLTGRRLFAGASELEAIEKVKSAKVPAPSALNSQLPAALDPIVFKALARDPADRFADANEFQLSLSRFLYTAGSGATASTLGRYMGELFGDTEARRRDAAVATEEPASSLSRSEIDATLREGIGPRRRAIEPTQPPRAEDSQIFAIRPEIDSGAHSDPELVVPLEEVTARGRTASGASGEAAGRRSQVVDVGAGKGTPVAATMALPSIDELPPQPARAGQTIDDEKTSVFKSPRALERPEVPVLRFPPKERGKGAVLEVKDALAGFPSAEELAALADALDETSPPAPAPARRSDVPERPFVLPAPTSPPPRAATAPPAASAPAPAPAPAAVEPAPAPADSAAAATAQAELEARVRTTDSGLLGLLARPPSGELPSVAAPAAASAASAGRAGADDGAPRPRTTTASARRAPPVAAPGPKKISGIVSSTMRLFVEGLDEDEPPAGAAAAAPVLSSGLTGAEEVPRTIKPTTLGWIVIAVVVLGAAGFVVYKKTDLLRGSADDGTDLVRTEDVKRALAKQPTTKKGTIRLASQPEGAHFFQFVGEAPATLAGLDPSRSHLLRVERDGYQPVYKVVDPKEWSGERAELKITLSPAGAAREELPPRVDAARRSGRGTLKVASEPPMAMIWLLVGTDKLELDGVDADKSHNFKALLAGHQPILVNVAPVDFDKASGLYSTTVRLEKEGGGAADAAPGASPPVAAAGDAAPKAEPKVEPKAEPKVETHTRTKLVKAPLKRPKRPAPTKKPAKKKKDDKKAAPKTVLPDWAK